MSKPEGHEHDVRAAVAGAEAGRPGDFSTGAGAGRGGASRAEQTLADVRCAVRGRCRCQHTETHHMLPVAIHRHKGGGRLNLRCPRPDGVHRPLITRQLQASRQRQPLGTHLSRHIGRRFHGQLQPLVMGQIGKPGRP